MHNDTVNLAMLKCWKVFLLPVNLVKPRTVGHSYIWGDEWSCQVCSLDTEADCKYLPWGL